MLTLGLVLEEVVNLADGAVESNTVEPMVGSVKNQVLAHNGKTNEAEISSGGLRSLADIDASKTCAEVSKRTKSI